MTWHPDESGITLNPGNTLGDNQISDEWSVRLVRDDVPGSYIDVTFAVELNPSTERYSPEGVLMFGTEDGWGDLLYDDDHAFDYESPDEALPFTERAVRDYAANADKYLNWDGRTQKIR